MEWMCRMSGRVLAALKHAEEAVDQSFHPVHTRRPDRMQPDAMPGARTVFRHVRAAHHRLDVAAELDQAAREVLHVTLDAALHVGKSAQPKHGDTERRRPRTRLRIAIDHVHGAPSMMRSIEIEDALAIDRRAEIAFDPSPSCRAHPRKAAVRKRGEAVERRRKRIAIADRVERAGLLFAHQLRNACDARSDDRAAGGIGFEHRQRRVLVDFRRQHDGAGRFDDGRKRVFGEMAPKIPHRPGGRRRAVRKRASSGPLPTRVKGWRAVAAALISVATPLLRSSRPQ